MRIVAALLATLLSLTGTSLAMGAKPSHSAIEVEAKPAGDNLQFTFKVKPNENMVVTLDAPWKLEVKGEGLAFPKPSLNKAEMDDKLPGYVVTTTGKPGKTEGEVEYSLTSFICNADKTSCFREVHTGKHPWKVAAK